MNENFLAYSKFFSLRCNFIAVDVTNNFKGLSRKQHWINMSLVRGEDKHILRVPNSGASRTELVM